jgi:hypothetical protein
LLQLIRNLLCFIRFLLVKVKDFYMEGSMKTKSICQFLAILSLIFAQLACGLPTQNSATVTPAGSAPGNVETFAVQLTLTALAVSAGNSTPSTGSTPAPGESSSTPTLTYTPTQAFTPTWTSTLTSIPTGTTIPTPCNAAQFVTDVTYPDGTEVGTNDTFVKTWRLKNVGSCTWTSGYKVIFETGDQMNAPASASFTSGTVGPGGTADISVSLKAPSTEGTYKGNFKLKDPEGQIFGIGANATNSFYVEIKAVSNAPHVVPLNPLPLKTYVFTLKPDLQITHITISPNPVTHGNSAHIKVTVKNSGGGFDDDFKVYWWAKSSYLLAACNWTVDGLAFNASKTLSCDYTYPAALAAGAQCKAKADGSNVITESDEANNVLQVSVIVN